MSTARAGPRSRAGRAQSEPPSLSPGPDRARVRDRRPVRGWPRDHPSRRMHHRRAPANPRIGRGRSAVLVHRSMGVLPCRCGNVLVSIFWFMLLFAWIWLLITVFADIFRDHELSGWGKALWALFIIVIPWLGALVYLIARGRSMNERALAQAQRQDQAFRQYVHENGEQSAERGRRAGEVGGPARRGDDLGARVRTSQGATAGRSAAGHAHLARSPPGHHPLSG